MTGRFFKNDTARTPPVSVSLSGPACTSRRFSAPRATFDRKASPVSDFTHFTPTWGRTADAYELDESIAVAHARSKVAAAHGLTERASMWADVTAALGAVRRERQLLAQATADAVLGIHNQPAEAGESP